MASVPLPRSGAALVAAPAVLVGVAGCGQDADPEAAALPLGALTARQALVDHAHLRPREQVLVHGGAGAVGAYVVQLGQGTFPLAPGRTADGTGATLHRTPGRTVLVVR
jgi:hypothetical protein